MPAPALSASQSDRPASRLSYGSSTPTSSVHRAEGPTVSEDVPVVASVVFRACCDTPQERRSKGWALQCLLGGQLRSRQVAGGLVLSRSTLLMAPPHHPTG